MVLEKIKEAAAKAKTTMKGYATKAKGKITGKEETSKTEEESIEEEESPAPTSKKCPRCGANMMPTDKVCWSCKYAEPEERKTFQQRMAGAPTAIKGMAVEKLKSFGKGRAEAVAWGAKESFFFVITTTLTVIMVLASINLFGLKYGWVLPDFFYMTGFLSRIVVFIGVVVFVISSILALTLGKAMGNTFNTISGFERIILAFDGVLLFIIYGIPGVTCAILPGYVCDYVTCVDFYATQQGTPVAMVTGVSVCKLGGAIQEIEVDKEGIYEPLRFKIGDNEDPETGKPFNLEFYLENRNEGGSENIIKVNKIEAYAMSKSEMEKASGKCNGTAIPCEQLSSEGGYLQGECMPFGVATRCEDIKEETECNDQKGCSWFDGVVPSTAPAGGTFSGFINPGDSEEVRVKFKKMPHCSTYIYFLIKVYTEQMGGGSSNFLAVPSRTGYENYITSFRTKATPKTGPLDIYPYFYGTKKNVLIEDELTGSAAQGTGIFDVIIKLKNGAREGTGNVKKVTLIQTFKNLKPSDTLPFTIFCNKYKTKEVECPEGNVGNCMEIEVNKMVLKNSVKEVVCEGMITGSINEKMTDIIATNSTYEFEQQFIHPLAAIC